MKVLLRGGTLDITSQPAANTLALKIEHENETARYAFALELEAAEAFKAQDRIRDELSRLVMTRSPGQPPASYLAAREELEVSSRAYAIAVDASCPELEIADKRARFYRAAVAFAEEAKAFL